MTGPGAASDDRAMRVSDADREKVVDALRRHCSDGRLTLDEFGERLEALYAAKNVGELGTITADLPTMAPPAGKGRRRMTRTVVGIMGESDLRGRWRVGRRVIIVSLMGRCHVDLRQVELDAAELDIYAVSLMGGLSHSSTPAVSIHRWPGACPRRFERGSAWTMLTPSSSSSATSLRSWAALSKKAW